MSKNYQKSYIECNGIKYSLEHLSPSEITAIIMIGGETFHVPLWVSYRNHCYSRDFKTGDDTSLLLPENPQDKNRRLFCKDRWMYSHGLPELIQAMVQNSTCYRTTKGGLYYKLERSSHGLSRPDEGVYVFFELSPNSFNPKGVRLSIESVHERTTRPANDRGRQSLKFWAVLKEILKKHPHILDAHRKAKGP
jgi:hypothetical protein